MDVLQDEVESLEAILMDDVRIRRNAESNIPELIETTIFPLADEQHEQHICVTLQVLPTHGYPDVSPAFKLLRPCGLDDARLEEISHAIEEKLSSSLGFPVVFDLIEIVRENLTRCNLPSGRCVICLYGFSDGDELSRTECFHYLHSHCLYRHLRAVRRNYKDEFNKLPQWQRQIAKPFTATCPVCRETIKDETDSLSCAMAPAELQNAPDFELTQELRDMQKRMSELFLQQKSRGAIIDEHDRNASTVITLESEREMLCRFFQGCETTTNTTMTPKQQQPSTSAMHVSTNGSIKCSSKEANQTAAEQKHEAERENQPNRRHYRGGRRHQQHHYHQRDRERERERFEHNHMSSSSLAASSSSQQQQQHKHSADTGGTATTSKAAAAATGVHNNSNAATKHTKSNAPGHSHNR